MKDSRSQYSSSISIILICILVIGVGIYLMSGLSVELKSSKIEYATAKKENDLLVQKKKDLDQAISTLQSKSSDIAIFSQAMPADAQLPEAFTQTEFIMNSLSAGGSGVSVKTFQIGAPVDADGRIPVNLTVDTDLNNLIALTKKFHDNLRPFAIDSVNITAKDSAVFSASLTMGLTYSPVVAQTGKATQATAEDNSSLKKEL